MFTEFYENVNFKLAGFTNLKAFCESSWVKMNSKFDPYEKLLLLKLSGLIFKEL